jgi:hypothetical protein
MELFFQDIASSFKCGPYVFLCLISEHPRVYERAYFGRTQDEMRPRIEETMQQKPPFPKTYQLVERTMDKLVYQTSIQAHRRETRFERLVFQIIPEVKIVKMLGSPAHTGPVVGVAIYRYFCRVNSLQNPKSVESQTERCELQPDPESRLGIFLAEL